MSVILGSKASETNMYLPLSSCSWSIGSIASSGTLKNTTLLSVSTNYEEALDVRRCFNDVTHVFAFGRNVRTSIISVTLICFLGGCGDGNPGFSDVQKLQESYEFDRLYENPEPMDISIAGHLTMSGFLIGMRVGETNTAQGTTTVTFTFLPEYAI